MNKLLEETTKAAQTAELLCSDLKQAHGVACYKNDLAEIICLDLLQDAIALKRKCNRLAEAVGYES